MELWLARSPWIGIILWIILYISDYYLTVYSARGFRQIGHFKFEGGFELTPQYEKDIEALKPISRLHIILLNLYSLIIFAIVVGVCLLSGLALGIFDCIWECSFCWKLQCIFVICEIFF